jgi:hypothetical protein
MLLYAQSDGLRKVLALLKSSGIILQLSGGIMGVICVKNLIAATELWVDGDFEMIAVEVKGMDLKYMWQIMSIYRAANVDMLLSGRLAACNLHTRNLTK